MKIVLFCHSLRSDWNHGNAHFLRGIVTDLSARGHVVDVYEPADAWSVENARADHGAAALEGWQQEYPGLRSHVYVPGALDLDVALDGAELVIVHEWNEPALVAAIGEHRRTRPGYRLLFHDTHHRAVTKREEMERLDLRDYDGALCFGAVIRDMYLERGWTQRAWTWHEAADVRVFRPRPDEPNEGDVVWIGNWGDGERTDELRTLLIEPVHALGVRARIYGVRYPDRALRLLRAAGIEYGGWLPNHQAPRMFARFHATVHVPRRPYVEKLPGIPTIRVFEALACGIPLVSAWWEDAERLFTPGADYLVARDGAEMQRQLGAVLNDPGLAASLSRHGLRTVLERHTCTHRVNELFTIARSLGIQADDTLPDRAGTAAANRQARCDAATGVASGGNPLADTPKPVARG